MTLFTTETNEQALAADLWRAVRLRALPAPADEPEGEGNGRKKVRVAT